MSGIRGEVNITQWDLGAGDLSGIGGGTPVIPPPNGGGGGGGSNTQDNFAVNDANDLAQINSGNDLGEVGA